MLRLPNFIIKELIITHFKENMNSRFSNVDEYPILRMYSTIENVHGFELYLKLITDYRYRNAVSKLRASSHTLEVERGRHTNPATELSKRLCRHWHMLEDETYFILSYKILFYPGERNIN